MGNKLITKYIESPRYISNIDRIASSFVILTIFLSILTSFELQLLFYLIIAILIVLKIWLRNIKKIKLDAMHYWLLYLIALTLIISLWEQGDNLRTLLHLVESFIAIFAISLFGVYSKDAKIIAIFALLNISLSQLISKGFITDHSISYIGLLFTFYYLIVGKKWSAFIFILLTIPLATRSVAIGFVTIYLLWLIKDKIKLIDRKWMLYTAPIIFIMLLLGLVFYIGVYTPYDPIVVELTTTRSINYGILMDDLGSRGIEILFPSGNLYSERLISSSNPSELITPNHKLYKLLYSLESQCTHCTYLEWLFDYGLILGSSVILFLVKTINIKTIWYVFIYIIVIGLQCGALTAQMIVPLYVVYYLSNNLTVQIKRV
jgi:hypothetical protein